MFIEKTTFNEGLEKKLIYFQKTAAENKIGS